MIYVSYHNVLCQLCLILVGPGVPIILGRASKQAKGEMRGKKINIQGAKKLTFKGVPKVKGELKVIFHRGDLKFRGELGPLRTPCTVIDIGLLRLSP